VYVRIASKFPTAEELRLKMLQVPDLAVRLHVAFHDAFACMQPYIHHLLHCKDWAAYDLVDRTAEALEHLNKVMKARAKLTCRRRTSAAEPADTPVAPARERTDPAPQPLPALVTPPARRSKRKHHKEGAGTCLTVMKGSVVASHFRNVKPVQLSARERKISKEARKPSRIVKAPVS